jgi:hypothetical protein
MEKFSRLATTAAAITLMFLPAAVVLAQNAPTTGTKTATPAATTAAPTDAKPATTAEQATGRKKKPRSAHYRKSAPKEYVHLVPLDKLW